MASNTIEAKILISAMNKSDGAFRQATAQSARMAATMDAHAKRIGGAFRNTFAMIGGFAFGKKAVESFIGDKAAFARVERQLRNLGDKSGKAFEHVSKKAAEFQERFNLGDDDVVKGMANLLRWGRMNKTTFDKAALVTANWAKMHGTSYEDASGDISKMVDDFEHAKKAFAAQGIDITKNKERWEAWGKSQQGRRKVMNEILDTLGGRLGDIGDVIAKEEGIWGKARIRFDDLLERVGELITKYAEPLKELVESPAKFEAAWANIAASIDKIAKAAGPIVGLLNSANNLLENMKKGSPLGGGFDFADPKGPAVQGNPNTWGGSLLNRLQKDIQNNRQRLGLPPSDTPQSRINDAFEALRTPGPQSSATGGAATGTFATKASSIMSRLQNEFGVTRAQAAGVVGNLGAETGGFRLMQEQSPLGGGRGGWGWAQWTGSRRRQFEAWAAANGLDPAGDAANWGFLKHELNTTHRGSLESLRRQKTVHDATIDFERTFERAGVKNYGARLGYANRAFGLDNAPRHDPLEMAREQKREAQRGFALGRGEVRVQVSVDGPGRVSGMKGRSGENLDVSAGIDNSGLSSAHRSAFPAGAP